MSAKVRREASRRVELQTALAELRKQDGIGGRLWTMSSSAVPKTGGLA